MKAIQETQNITRWPRKRYEMIEARKRDLIVRITDWTKDKDEPAWDVEVYIGGIYDWNESQSFSTKRDKPAKKKAIEYAAAQIAKLL
jgi:hypothetical protein